MLIIPGYESWARNDAGRDLIGVGVAIGIGIGFCGSYFNPHSSIFFKMLDSDNDSATPTPIFEKD